MTWVERKTVTYRLEDLPFDDEDKLTIMDPSIIKLHIPKYDHPIDIGSWCYTKRRRGSLDTRSPKTFVQKVQPRSFRIQRCDFVRGYIEYLRWHIRLGKSLSTILNYVTHFRQFVSWCDKHQITGLDSKECFVRAVHDYTEEMIHNIRKSRLNINTAATSQQRIISIGRAVYDDPYLDLFRSVRKLGRSLEATNITKKPENEIARRTINVYKDLFEQLSGFVLNFESFPKRLDFEHGYFWFFPTLMPFAGPTNIKSKEMFKKLVSYDHINGTIRSLDEVKKLSKSCTPNSGVNTRKRCLKLIEEANRDRFHKSRFVAAKIAFKAFMMMFSATTGMGLGQMASLPWTGEYETEKQQQGFKTIKYRAHREVSFYITSNFFSIFKKGLLLRSYILNSLGIADFEYLFFSHSKQTIHKLNLTLSTQIHNTLKNSFDFHHKVTTRMWRAFKSDWFLRKTDIQTTSLLLQNTPETVMKHYAEGSEDEAEQEFTKFFAEYRNTLVISASLPSTPLAAGQCLHLDPVAIPNAPIKPDCSQPEGCLFCDKYRVHADKTDYKKLLSFRYVLENCKTLAHDEEHFKRLLLPVIEKIDELLSQILDNSDLSNDTAEKLREDVYQNENLDNYWQKKINLLDDRGAF